MFEAECVGPERVRVHGGAEGRESSRVDVQLYMSTGAARHLVAKLLVAIERAERLERDMRAPG